MIEKLMLLFMWLYIKLDNKKVITNDLIILKDTESNRKSKQLN